VSATAPLWIREAEVAELLAQDEAIDVLERGSREGRGADMARRTSRSPVAAGCTLGASTRGVRENLGARHGATPLLRSGRRDGRARSDVGRSRSNPPGDDQPGHAGWRTRRGRLAQIGTGSERDADRDGGAVRRRHAFNVQPTRRTAGFVAAPTGAGIDVTTASAARSKERRS
jgi:hypothetical protein